MCKRRSVAVLAIIFCVIVVGHYLACAESFAQAREASRPRVVSAPPAGEMTITLQEQFLNSFLEAMFTELRAPSFKLSRLGDDTQSRSAIGADSSHASSQNSCPGVVVLEREMSGVKTAVRFEQGRIVAPLAFSGSYNQSLVGCLRFQGWADTIINLEFDRERQTLRARADVRDIHLNGVPTLANNLVLKMIQNAVDSRLNPIEILRAAQLSARVPIAAAGGALTLRAREIRPEVVAGALQLHIIYEFVRAEQKDVSKERLGAHLSR